MWEQICDAGQEVPEEFESWFSHDEKHTEPLSLPDWDNTDDHPIAARASIRFPGKAEYGVEYGFQCRKCKEHSLWYKQGSVPLFTRVELWEHSKTCCGAPGLLEKLETDFREASTSTQNGRNSS